MEGCGSAAVNALGPVACTHAQDSSIKSAEVKCDGREKDSVTVSERSSTWIKIRRQKLHIAWQGGSAAITESGCQTCHSFEDDDVEDKEWDD